MTAAAAPARPLGEIDDAHRRVFDAAGHKVNTLLRLRLLARGDLQAELDGCCRPIAFFRQNSYPSRAGHECVFLHAMLEGR